MVDMPSILSKGDKMITIILENIQSIKSCRFDFPDHGVVQFKGNNSNGKSILSKVMGKIVKQQLQYDDKRLPLIRDGCDEGKFAMEANGQILLVVINRAVNKCYYLLQRRNGERVMRGLRDGGIDALLKEFGLVIFDKGALCLQLCETYGPMPFINTSDSLNGEIVQSVITDFPCEKFVQSYPVTHKEAKQRLNQLKTQEQRIDAAISQRKIYNTVGLPDLIKKVETYMEYKDYANYIKPLDKLVLVPNMDFSIKRIEPLEMMVMPVKLPLMTPLSNIDATLYDMFKIKRGVCPTCGKRLLNGTIHEHAGGTV